VKSLGIEKVVSFHGMLRHQQAMQRLGAADVLVFPSVHEFGGAVVFEALALGVVPVVVDFGGPGDLVHPEAGFKVPLTNENDVVLEIEKILAKLARDRGLVDRLRQQGMSYARECLSWDWKARIVTRILRWAVGQGPKPDLQPPKRLCPQNC
jgi:glycosyltransferase involved in cell wall biosynthesis